MHDHDDDRPGENSEDCSDVDDNHVDHIINCKRFVARDWRNDDGSGKGITQDAQAVVLVLVLVAVVGELRHALHYY